MKVEYSKEFARAVELLSGKTLKAVIGVIQEVIDAPNIYAISDCRKIEGLNNVYRIRIGSRRAFFVLHIEIQDEIVRFEYLVNRGEAYDKKMMERLRRRDEK